MVLCGDLMGHFTVVYFVTWPWIRSEAGVDFVLMQTWLLFICKCKLVSIRTAWSSYEKQWGLYQNCSCWAQNRTSDAVNKISISFSNAVDAALSAFAILVIVTFSGFTWPTLSEMLHSKHGGKTFFESFLGASLNNRAHVRPSCPHHFPSPEALHKIFKCSIFLFALVSKTPNWIVVNFNWNRRKQNH